MTAQPEMTEDERYEALHAAGAEIDLFTRERSLEIALGEIADLFGNLEGQSLRDAVTNLVARREQEIRLANVLTRTILLSIGFAEDDEPVVALTERAGR